MPIEAVFFDVGETLVDESRMWLSVASSLGIPAFTLLGVVGGLAARGEDHRRAFALLCPGVPVPDAPPVTAADFYPDALPCLVACRAAGWVIGLAGNQPAAAEARLRDLGLDVDVVASSAGWGVEKPSPEFFARVVAAAGCQAGRIAYVGDRVDNDVRPAAATGMVPVFVRRGPWGVLHADAAVAAGAALCVDGLAGLADRLRGLSV
ncbi:MAG TPA: HAD family hydrolase [Acidimicrobiales bacterium]|nr:HAD family hydrolase [Acidimicrobiales bacterium]